MRRAIIAGICMLLAGVARAQVGVPACNIPDKSCVGSINSEMVIFTNGVTANQLLAALPPNAVLHSIDVQNTTANAVTGGINVGTTATGADVVSAFAVAANATVTIQASTLLKQYISATLYQPLYVSAASAWNSASLNIRVRYGQ